MAQRNFDQPTIAWAKSLGFIEIEKTEKLQRHSFNKNDMFGFADFIAIDSQRTCLIQSTSYQNISTRIKKIVAIPAAKLWIQNPTRLILVIGFGPPKDKAIWLDESDFEEKK